MKVLMINTVPTDNNGITNVIFNIIKNINKNNLKIDYLSINTPKGELENEAMPLYIRF